MRERLTKNDVEKIQAEIEHRKLVERKELIEAVKEARSHALAVYLPILIIGWTIIGTLFGLGVCSAIRIDLIQSLADILCAGGYAGIFLGLFGGILYLYRK